MSKKINPFKLKMHIQDCEIDEYKKRILELEKQLIAECKEHQEAMQVADKTIRLLNKALELACLSTYEKCFYCKYKNDEMCPPDHSCSSIVMEYFLKEAEEMMKDAQD